MGMQGGKVIIFDSYLIRSEMAAHRALCAIFSGIRGGGGGDGLGTCLSVSETT